MGVWLIYGWQTPALAKYFLNGYFVQNFNFPFPLERIFLVVVSNFGSGNARMPPMNHAPNTHLSFSSSKPMSLLCNRNRDHRGKYHRLRFIQKYGTSWYIAKCKSPTSRKTHPLSIFSKKIYN